MNQIATWEVLHGEGYCRCVEAPAGSTRASCLRPAFNSPKLELDRLEQNASCGFTLWQAAVLTHVGCTSMKAAAKRATAIRSSRALRSATVNQGCARYPRRVHGEHDDKHAYASSGKPSVSPQANSALLVCIGPRIWVMCRILSANCSKPVRDEFAQRWCMQ